MKKLSFLVALICILLFFLPSLLSTSTGKGMLIRTLERRLSAQIQVGELSLGWTKPQKIKDFRFEKKGELSLNFDSLTLDTYLWNLIFRSGSLGETTLTKPQLVTYTKKGSFPGAKVASQKAPKKKSPLWSNLSGKIKLKEGAFAAHDLMQMSEVNGVIDVPKGLFPLSIEATGKTKNKNLLGSFQAKGRIDKEGDIIGEAHFTNFPVASIDAFTNGLFLEALGDNLNLDLLFSKEKVSIDLRSPLMTTSLTADYQKGAFILQSPMRMSWTIQPSLLQALNVDLPASLVGNAHADIEIDRLTLPLESMHSLSATGKINMQPFAVTLGETKQSLLLDNLNISFSTSDLGESINLSLQNSFRFNSLPAAKVEATSTVQRIFSKEAWLAKLSECDVIVRSFPTAIFDQKIQKWIGSNFDVEVKKRGQDLTVSGRSSLLNLETAHFTVQNGIRLKESANVTYQGIAGDLQSLSIEDSTLTAKIGLGKGSIDLLAKYPSRIQAHFDQISTQIADSFFQMNGTLNPMIGSPFDCALDLSGQMIEVNVKSPYLKVSGAFKASDKLELRSNRSPLRIEWNVSEEGLAAYKKWRKIPNQTTFAFKDRVDVDLSVSPLSIPFDFNLYHALFDANLKIDSLFEFSLSKTSAPGGALTFEVEGSADGGKIKGKGTLENILTPKGTVNLNDMTASIQANIKHLPTTFLDPLSTSNLPPSAFLGERLNGSFDAQLIKDNGKLNIDIDATNCRARLDGTIGNGILYLNEPLKAAMTISPKMNEILSREAKLAVAAKPSPFTLIISDKDFSVPIKSLTLKDTTLSYGILDFGQIACRNTGSASDVSGLFKIGGSQEMVSLWFAPMEFNISRGVMHVQRTEILYNHAYQVALWGGINFNRRYVDMVLGLTAQSLRAALGISGLDASYVLQVPVTGPFGNVKIDTGAASSKITWLLARKEIIPRAGVWGQVFGALSDLTDDQSNVPPPRPPFPWSK